jgi:hypothetical protein
MCWITAIAAMILAGPLARADEGVPLRIGLIGLDSSHAVTFTELINDTSRRDHVPGGRVVAAYKGWSRGLPSSDTRIERFTAAVTGKWEVPLVDSIETLLARVDAVLLLSVDARQHLAQVRPLFAALEPATLRLAAERFALWLSTAQCRQRGVRERDPMRSFVVRASKQPAVHAREDVSASADAG